MNAVMPWSRGPRFPRHVERLIERSGRTQREIATALGYGRSNIVTMFKQGTTRVPGDKVPALADALGVEVGQITNSLVFTIDDEPILVLTSGAHRVDTDWLGDRLGGTIRRASKETVKAATGQVIGGVAPVGHPAPVRTIVDGEAP